MVSSQSRTPWFIPTPAADTDVDVLGVRFPYGSENRQRPMVDSERFRRHRDKAYVALAEIKTGVCRLNGPWTSPERENMQRVLSALGVLAPHEIDFAAQQIYDNGHFENQLHYVSMVCFGSEPRDEITERYPRVPLILWPEVKESTAPRRTRVTAVDPREGRIPRNVLGIPS